MILCLDIGNTHIYGGVFDQDNLKFTLRYSSRNACTSDELGLFFKNVLRENNIKPEEIDAICLASVVPSLDYSVTSACIKYLNLQPLHLNKDTKTNLTLKVDEPDALGADRIANAVAAMNYFPKQNAVIIDFGTATTVCAISKEGEYLGGTIMPGVNTAMQSLYQQTAKLSSVEIIKQGQALGKTTTQHIQAGLYLSQLGGIKEITQRLHSEAFPAEESIILASGGYAYLFENENLFDKFVPDLVLHGLYFIYQLNKQGDACQFGKCRLV